MGTAKAPKASWEPNVSFGSQLACFILRVSKRYMCLNSIQLNSGLLAAQVLLGKKKGTFLTPGFVIVATLNEDVCCGRERSDLIRWTTHP